MASNLSQIDPQILAQLGSGKKVGLGIGISAITTILFIIAIIFLCPSLSPCSGSIICGSCASAASGQDCFTNSCGSGSIKNLSGSLDSGSLGSGSLGSGS